MAQFNALGPRPLGMPRPVFLSKLRSTAALWTTPTLSVSSLIIPERNVSDGILIRSTSDVWAEIVQRLGSDWSVAYQLTPEQWEELVAGAFKKAGYDDVTLTPRSRDYGRDVIAIKHGIGCVKIIGSVKAYKPGNLVSYDAIRALLGVMQGERDTSKGIITTTSDFPPRVGEDPIIRPFMPTRLELINGQSLQKWLADLAGKS
jgi:restriction system protein